MAQIDQPNIRPEDSKTSDKMIRLNLTVELSSAELRGVVTASFAKALVDHNSKTSNQPVDEELSVGEAALRAKRSISTIRRLVDKGTLKSYSLGKGKPITIMLSDLKALLQERKIRRTNF